MESLNSKKYNFFFKGTNGKAVLLIHGITGTPSEMSYLGRSLHKVGFSVLCNALPRHCASLYELKKVTWQEIEAACIADYQTLSEQYQKVFICGLSMGALLAVHIAHKFTSGVTGIVALAPTVFYDGWALHKGKILLDLAWHIPYLRRRINIREGWPYGLKDETIRGHIERFYKSANAGALDDKVLLFGSPFFPLACLYQHHRFAKVVKKELPAVSTPILAVHAQEDDMVSIKNAQYLLEHIGSPDKKLVTLKDSYHMITIDKEKDLVAREVIAFVNKF